MATKQKTSLNGRQKATRPSSSFPNRGGKTSRRHNSKVLRDRDISTPLVVKFVCGIVLGILTLYLLFSFGSYLINGAANQSLFIDSTSSGDINNEIKGHVGIHGSRLMHELVNGWLGLGFVFILYLLGYLSLTLLVKSRTNHLKHFILGGTMAFWTSLALSMLPEQWTRRWFFLPGGVIGDMMSKSLAHSIGEVGIYLLLILVLVLMVFLTFSDLQERYTHWSRRRAASIKKFQESSAKNTSTPEESVESVQPIHPLDVETKEGEKGLFENTERNILSVDVIPTPINPTVVPEESVLSSNTEEPLIDNRESVIPTPVVASTLSQKTTKEEEVLLEVVDNRHIEEEPEENSKRTAAHLVEELGPYDPRKELSKYQFPHLDLLKRYDQENREIDKNEIQDNKELITSTFNSFNIEILSITATVGPAITLYEVVPAAGVHISRIRGLEENIAMSLSALGIRIIAPMPGKGTIGLEVPNKNPQIVSMRSVIASSKFQNSEAELPIALGRTITNEVFVFDLAKTPHLLVAGATGQGKSVGLNAIITSLLYTKHPSELKFVMVDPKMVEFSMYALIEKHYMAKLPGEEQVIITDTKRVAATLNSLCQEMDDRYELLAKAHVRNIKEYNALFVERNLNPEKGHRYLPYLVLIIDEYGDLLITAGKEIELPITRLAQKARAVGIHAIIATQRPTAKIITGAIKANFPGRIAFRVTSSMDSRIILDTPGANRLVGKGDLLYQSGSAMTRVQCAFVDTPEVNGIVDFISSQRGYASAYELPEPEESQSSISSTGEGGSGMVLDPNDKDEIYDEVARMLVLEQRASISLIQQKFSIGYNRAARLMNQLVAGGIVTPKEGNKPQEVIPTSLEELF